MIHLKNEEGFTLIEVLLAVAIVGIVLGPIYILQSTVFERVIRAAGSVDRVLVAYDFFVDVKSDDEDVVKKTVEDPSVDMVYEKKEPSKESELAKEFNHIYIKKVSWHWKYQDTSYSDLLVDIAFMPPEKKSVAAGKAMAGQGEQKRPQPAGEKQKGDENKGQDKKDEKKI